MFAMIDRSSYSLVVLTGNQLAVNDCQLFLTCVCTPLPRYPFLPSNIRPHTATPAITNPRFSKNSLCSSIPISTRILFPPPKKKKESKLSQSCNPSLFLFPPYKPPTPSPSLPQLRRYPSTAQLTTFLPSTVSLSRPPLLDQRRTISIASRECVCSSLMKGARGGQTSAFSRSV